ncbi:class II histocompatibility antigen, M alpha chain [Thamnophis elegans]|uniref:class II histocompatibility antigen, M alpha chain n=1 Tax=Thamnophis elegans TaxID=35005 RepID=UPI0013775074|nr:class II histocompatibility antigen, M alpha chain [Thamnophis elegans]
MGPGLRRWALPALALIWAALASAGEQPAHLSSEVFFCQKDSPLYGLARTLDDDLLFWYDFPSTSWRSRLPDFQAKTQLSEPQIEARKKVCDVVLPALTKFSDLYAQIQFPEATGIPEVEIFTLRPLVLGQPNVLVCSARNIFPPVARIRWAFQGQELTQGVSSTPVFPVQELDFQIFSYVEMTPREGDIYSCTVKGLGGKFDTMAYWAPKDPVASKLLENVLCGLAVAVGGVFIIVGVVLLALSFRFRSSD